METKHIHAVIVRRSNEENTVAIVDADCDPDSIQTPDDLFGAISNAIAEWYHEDDEAGTIIDDNDGDFNVGDLANELPDESLEKRLAAWGVTNLVIECHVGESTAWDYDDSLYQGET